MTADMEARELALRIAEVPAPVIAVALESVTTWQAQQGLRLLLDDYRLRGPVADMIRYALSEGERGAPVAEAFRAIYTSLLNRAMGIEDAVPLPHRLRAIRGRAPVLSERVTWENALAPRRRRPPRRGPLHE